jgi:beta-glucosidase
VKSFRGPGRLSLLAILLEGAGCAVAAAAPAAPPSYRDARAPIEARVADLLGRMTLEEKIAQLWIAREDAAGLTPEVLARRYPHGLAALGRVGLKRSPRETAVLTNAVQKGLVTGTRLGIPAFFVDEALHGLMNQGSTSFPQAIALASTWDPALAEQAFGVAAAEMRARGSNWALSPVLDLAREPRWGRTEETYGEDPYLVSRMGVAAIRGLQGRAMPGAPIDGRHVLATAKHFAAHGQPEGGTNAAPANYSIRILREQFLVPFQAAVREAGVSSVMASYNEIDGVPSHVNRWLLTDLLRGEWGFRGFVTSDGGAIDELVRIHHVAADRAEAVRKSLAAGIDFELGNAFAAVLAAEVQRGAVSGKEIDRAVAGVLRAKFRLGLFESPYVDPEAADRVTNDPAARALALRAAREAIVLLKNDKGILPLDRRKLRRVAVIGPDAADTHLGGYSVDPGRTVSILDGIRAKLGSKVRVDYAEGVQITAGHQTWQAWFDDEVAPPDRAREPAAIAAAAKLAKSADVAIVVVGENEGICREGWAKNHLGDRDDLGLVGGQAALVRAVAATGRPTVVFLINGRPLAVPEIAAAVPAILEGFYLGEETGTAVADVLFGDVSPSGKLPITFPRNVGQLPDYYYQKPSARRGYLWSDSSPLWPFGYGLSYTTFAYDHLTVTPARIPPSGSAEVTVDVTNTGRVAGDEVVELYLHDQTSSVTRPVKELKGFARVALAPGEKKTVRLTVTPEALALLDADMRRTVEPGLFDVMVGPSSADLKTAVLEVVP